MCAYCPCTDALQGVMMKTLEEDVNLILVPFTTGCSHAAVAAILPALPRTTMCSSWHCRQILHTCRHFAASMHALIHLFFINRISVLGLTRTRRGIRVSVVSKISKGLSRVPPRLRISMIWDIILAVESVTIPHGGRTFLYNTISAMLRKTLSAWD